MPKAFLHKAFLLGHDAKISRRETTFLHPFHPSEVFELGVKRCQVRRRHGRYEAGFLTHATRAHCCRMVAII
ncbi:hypothetical protein Fuma_01428 [Fuerstiella marisgermanici]|uniref:Uncharacterized protein n=1 Tax=Fuerstiella marisgermanici TaxID=1891926 RepID=A0A1P8WCP9_9PLAN|nr:hypothetical protein Fuma_01428 [Fuerstiella marisgermanici]